MPTDTLLQRLISQGAASRTWQRDTAVFVSPNGPGAAIRSVETRLGWLDAPTDMAEQMTALQAFARDVRTSGITDVYLLGMGGSSLCAEVLRDVPIARRDPLRLTVLDTTDERRVRDVTDALIPASSLFLVASKSGDTIEVTSLEQHFFAVLSNAGIEQPGRHFVAITDPDTALVALAEARGYRHTFLNDPNIGSRYSALSLFGLVPAALLGIQLDGLLDRARAMANRCRDDDADNPGLALGCYMATHARTGRDKLTLLVPPSLAPLGAWIEQLVAESTGKNGEGVLPVVGEPLGMPEQYGSDRAFVALVSHDSAAIETLARKLEQAGHPVHTIEALPAELGAEFFRWEFATAIAGAGLGVNPFDEPNVSAAKARTDAQLETRRSTGAFTMTLPLEPGPGYSRRSHGGTAPDGDAGAPKRPRYLAILDYLPVDPGRTRAIEHLRAAVRADSGAATTHGIGPRYLHSTGQFHKGGPNTGLFLLLTGADAGATPVPGAGYSFSTLKQAQALGDFDALVASGREVVHYHLHHPTADLSADLEKVALALAHR